MITGVLSAYPNPNYGNTVYVQLKDFQKLEPVTVSLFDMMGAKVKSVKVVADSNGEFKTHFEFENNGKNHFYIIRADYASGSRFAKIIVN